jgi:hypothetical protein
VESLRKLYKSSLLEKLEYELGKEERKEPLDYKFMEEVIRMKPSQLTKEETDIMTEIIASRLGRIHKRLCE